MRFNFFSNGGIPFSKNIALQRHLICRIWNLHKTVAVPLKVLRLVSVVFRDVSQRLKKNNNYVLEIMLYSN